MAKETSPVAARAERTTQITPDTLEQRAGDSRPDPAAELAALRERIAKAATLEPQPHDLHCRDCFHRGRNATLRLILDE